MMNIIIAGVKCQICNPGFEEARDALILADLQLYNGEHKCLIWQSFANRGVGVNSSITVGSIVFAVQDSNSIPPEC